MPDGSGHMGRSLIDDVYSYDRVTTVAGPFEVIFAGAGGAMQSFANRMTQDEMIKVVAHIRNLQMKKSLSGQKNAGLLARQYEERFQIREW